MPPHLQNSMAAELVKSYQQWKGRRRMRRLIQVSTLVLALSCSIYAGNIPFDKNPPPPEPTSIQEPTGGNIPFGPQVTATELALNLLGRVLSLL
jgi:hypothetical protein